jgi:hypothetical protein
MEPSTEIEMTAQVRARRIARRERIRRQAAGFRSWEAAVTLLQGGMICAFALWYPGEPSALMVAIFLFAVIKGDLAYMNRRLDAFLELTDNGRPVDEGAGHLP